MMAVMWILTYLAVHVDTVGFWWFFVCANSALGVSICVLVITNPRTRTSWQRQYGKKQNIQDSSINNINADEKNKATMNGEDKMGVKNIISSPRTSVAVSNNGDDSHGSAAAASGAANDGEVSDDDNNKDSAVKADDIDKTAPETRADDEAPLNGDNCSKEKCENGAVACSNGGITNEGAEFDSDAAMSQAKVE